jgi:nucleotide-binding universal stress UspA family protein
MRFEKILFHTRFREMSLNALESLYELKKAGLKEVILAYIIPEEEVAFVPYGGYLKEHEEQLRAKATITFDQWRQSLAAQGIGSQARIEVGSPNAKLLSIAETEKVDLIITGRKKRTLLEKVYVGSHILDMLRRSPVPILMHKHLAHYELNGIARTRINDHPFTRPMLATDWSQPSENAAKALVAFKPVAETALITHVIDAKLAKGVDEAGIKALEAESQRRLTACCRDLEKEGIKAESHLALGPTVTEILKLSRTYNASLIVMGRTGKDWLQEYWLGGVSHRIAEISELPVLLVP